MAHLSRPYGTFWMGTFQILAKSQPQNVMNAEWQMTNTEHQISEHRMLVFKTSYP